jgi:hemerythrin-like metal-binding protein
MRRINYSNSVAHRQKHDKLIQDVSKLQKKFDEGNAFLTVQVSKFLKDWLVQHIMKTDKALCVAIKVAAGAS